MLTKKPTNLLINLKQHIPTATFKRSLLTHFISGNNNNDCTITATVKGQYYHHLWYNHHRVDCGVQHQQVRQYYIGNKNGSINRNYNYFIGTNNKFDLIRETGLPRRLLSSTDTVKSPAAKKRKMVSFSHTFSGHLHRQLSILHKF